MAADTITSLETNATLYLRASITLGLFAVGCISFVLFAEGQVPGAEHVIRGLIVSSVAALIYAIFKCRSLFSAIQSYRSSLLTLQSLLDAKSSNFLRIELAELELRYRGVQLIEHEIELYRPEVQSKLSILERQEELERDAICARERHTNLNRHFTQVRDRVSTRVEELYQASPAVLAGRKLENSITKQNAIKDNVEKAWEDKKKAMSWWQNLNSDAPDCTKIDRNLETLQRAQARLKNSGDLQKTREYFDKLAARTHERIIALGKMTTEAVPSSHRTVFDDKAIAKSALWLSALSVPISAWSDVARTGEIYETLRSVNGNFADLSDSEIWLHSLMLPADSLAGLVSLTKGAYFERLVAGTTGGVLHADFNHPDTDIVIDGIAYQLKATDSEAYLDTVSDGIPIIATTEVALATDAIDSGFMNADLEKATDVALGGSVVDFGDTAVDAVLTGIGGLGLLATIRGINHAASKYNAGHDGGEAIFEGMDVALTGTAKAAVDTSELVYKTGVLGYKAVTSRPSRFAGRQLVKLASGTVSVGRKLHQHRRNSLPPDTPPS